MSVRHKNITPGLSRGILFHETGYITVASDIGAGATFSVYLPMIASQVEA